MKIRSNGALDSWSVGSLRLRASLQYSKPHFTRYRLRSCVTVCALLVVLGSSPDAQPGTTKTLRLGILEPGGSTNVCNDGLRQGLRGLGYVEKENLAIEARYAEWKPDRLKRFASELAQLKPDAIWTHGPISVRALKPVTATIPIILGVSRNLVELGIVASLARPGGNVTGMDLRDGEILGKRLELFKEALPKSSRVAVLADPNDTGHASIPKNIEQEAHALRVQLQRVETSGPEDFDRAFVAMLREQADSLILPESPALFPKPTPHIQDCNRQATSHSRGRITFRRSR